MRVLWTQVNARLLGVPRLPFKNRTMNKYEKAVAFMNDVLDIAKLGGPNNTIVYIVTSLGELRLHEDEVDAMAENWNRMNPHTHT